MTNIFFIVTRIPLTPKPTKYIMIIIKPPKLPIIIFSIFSISS